MNHTDDLRVHALAPLSAPARIMRDCAASSSAVAGRHELRAGRPLRYGQSITDGRIWRRHLRERRRNEAAASSLHGVVAA